MALQTLQRFQGEHCKDCIANHRKAEDGIAKHFNVIPDSRYYTTPYFHCEPNSSKGALFRHIEAFLTRLLSTALEYNALGSCCQFCCVLRPSASCRLPPAIIRAFLVPRSFFWSLVFAVWFVVFFWFCCLALVLVSWSLASGPWFLVFGSWCLVRPPCCALSVSRAPFAVCRSAVRRVRRVLHAVLRVPRTVCRVPSAVCPVPCPASRVSKAVKRRVFHPRRKAIINYKSGCILLRYHYHVHKGTGYSRIENLRNFRNR